MPVSLLTQSRAQYGPYCTWFGSGRRACTTLANHVNVNKRFIMRSGLTVQVYEGNLANLSNGAQWSHCPAILKLASARSSRIRRFSVSRYLSINSRLTCFVRPSAGLSSPLILQYFKTF